MAALLPWLGACATATVLKEDAGHVATATKAVVGEARAFYIRLGEKRVAYLLRTLATGEHCRYGWPAVLLRDAAQPSGWRCLDAAETRLRTACRLEPDGEGCATAQARTVRDAVSFDLAPTRHLAALALLDAMSEYTVALAGIVADPKLDAKAELTRLAERVETVRGLLDALQNDAHARLDLGKEIAAAAALLDLLRQAGEDRRDIEVLRTLLRDRGPAFEASLATLAAEYRHLHLRVAAVLDAQQLSDEVERYRKRAPSLGEEARVKAMQALAAAELAHAARAAAPDALSEAFGKLYAAHVELRQAALEDRWSEAQRRRQVAATLQKLTAWFAAIRDLLVLI